MRSLRLPSGMVAFLGVFAVTSAPAAEADKRYASPTGSGAACTNPAPCDLRTAIESATSGDEVILKTGSYPDEALGVNTAGTLDVHGESGKPPPLLSFTGDGGVLADSSSSLSDLRIVHTGTSSALNLVGTGRAERIQVRSENTVACGVAGATISDSLCSSGDSVAAGLGITSSGNTSATVRNVTVHSEGTAILVSAGDGANVSLNIFNTIAVGGFTDVRTTEGVGGVATATLSSSNFDSRDTSAGGSITAPGSGTNQTAAPLLAGLAAGDFHQLAGSPTIDAGVTSALNGSLDLDRQQRSQGARTDIGADEFAVARCGGKSATLIGTGGRDQLRGTPGRDVVAALGGNDVARGLGGKDVICGGKGRDRLIGGRGRDRLFGGAGRDFLRGGPGRDVLRGGAGRDIQTQ